MPHAVTQSCVGDGSCVYACPVNCIQPTPDDPAFELAEMLYIDPSTCVDCGACVTACPVDAIKPQLALTADEQEFVAINAAYFSGRKEARPPVARVRPRLRVRDRGEPIRIAIVGSGPAAMYAADELLTIPTAEVEIYERLDRPYGLVRSGVAPDHRRTRRITRQLDLIAAHPRLRMHLGVEIGRDLAPEALMARHHAVIYAVGSLHDRPLTIPGAGLPGVLSATELVGWYNGHPDFSEVRPELSHERAVVIGNGNVALDVARVLAVDPATLMDTEISPRALDALRASRIREVVVIGRRGPEASSFTLPELVGLSATPGVGIRVDAAALEGLPASDPKLTLLRRFTETPGGEGQISLRYLLAPVAIEGNGQAERIVLQPQERGADGSAAPIAGAEPISIEAGLVVSSIGFKGTPVATLPFDADSGTIPNDRGRVIDPDSAAALPGAYVVGWIKRGPTGFIGTNKRCAQETVATLVDDYNAGLLASPAGLAAATR